MLLVNWDFLHLTKQGGTIPLKTKFLLSPRKAYLFLMLCQKTFVLRVILEHGTEHEDLLFYQITIPHLPNVPYIALQSLSQSQYPASPDSNQNTPSPSFHTLNAIIVFSSQCHVN